MTSVLFGVAEASGASPPLTEHEILLLLVQLVLLIGTARILGGLFQRVGQPAVVGELLAGVVLGLGLHFGNFDADLVINDRALFDPNTGAARRDTGEGDTFTALTLRYGF